MSILSKIKSSLLDSEEYVIQVNDGIGWQDVGRNASENPAGIETTGCLAVLPSLSRCRNASENPAGIETTQYVVGSEGRIPSQRIRKPSRD